MNFITFEEEGVFHRFAVAQEGDGVWIGYQGGAAYITRHATDVLAKNDESMVRSPMTGKVISIETQPGFPVETGDLLVILEAMKMEFRLVAQKKGYVAEVRCAKGDLIQVGDTVVVLAEARVA